MIKTIIFDVGGVLIENHTMFNDVIDEFGLKKEDTQEYYAEIMKRFDRGEIDEKTFWELFKERFKITKDIIEPCPLVKFFGQGNKIIKNDVVSVVLNLKENGYNLAVLSNTILCHAEYIKKLGLYEIFDEVFLSYEAGMRKPEPEIYIYALKKLELKPEEVIFIDNQIENTEAAEKLGIKSILFENADQLKEELEILKIATTLPGQLPRQS
jgi:epoxide hydrolase-like predicted phosphatase